MSIPIGYSGIVAQGGASTPLSNAACSLVTGKTYQITTAAHRVLDPAIAIVVKENGTPSTASNILNVNALNGEVTFISSYSPTTPITISGNFIPTAAIGLQAGFEGSPKANTADVPQTNSAGFEMRIPTTLDWSGGFTYYGNLTDATLQAIVANKTPLLVTEDPDGTATALTRGWVLITEAAQGIKAKEVNKVDVKFTLFDQSPVATALSGFTVNAAVAFFTT